jgi:hypothetical protein
MGIMGTVMKGTIDGKWVELPQHQSDALAFGWHKGIDYDIRWFDENSKFYQIREWCETTFGINNFTYRTFEGSVWFYRKEDALLCKLRWS